MSALDYRKDPLFNPPADRFVIVDVPPVNILAIDGDGDPNTSPAYQQAVEALYALSYAIKFAIKKGQGIDYAVRPLEGLWWTDDPAQFSAASRDDWHWTMFISQPDPVTEAMVNEVRQQVFKRKALPALTTIRFERFDEGRAVQIMHIGPYSAEAPTIARLHGEFLPSQGFRENGHHHEIYLGDPRKSAPEKLRTILRQGVELKT